MRPTRGEIGVAPDSTQCTARASENSRVRLQRMPSFSRVLAALIPSQMEAILVRIRSESIELDYLPSFAAHSFGIIRQAGGHFCGNQTRDNFQNLHSETDQELISVGVDQSLARQPIVLASGHGFVP